MKRAAYPTHPNKKRSRIDLLADRAPRPLRLPAGAAALAVDKLVTAGMRARTAGQRRVAQARARPFPYVLAAVALGAGVGLMAYGPSRRAIVGGVSRGGNQLFGALSRQLSKEIRSLMR